MKVLLVDDHPLFLDGLRNLLVSRGFQVLGTARDGLEAVEKAHALRPDLILMDIQMPQLDGLAAVRLIKAELPEIKIVMLTMSADDENLFEAIKSGACGYVLKTQASDEFFALLRAEFVDDFFARFMGNLFVNPGPFLAQPVEFLYLLIGDVYVLQGLRVLQEPQDRLLQGDLFQSFSLFGREDLFDLVAELPIQLFSFPLKFRILFCQILCISSTRTGLTRNFRSPKFVQLLGRL